MVTSPCATNAIARSVHDVDRDVCRTVTLTRGKTLVAACLTCSEALVAAAVSFVPWYTDGALLPLFGVFLAQIFFVGVPDYLFLPFAKLNVAQIEAFGISRLKLVLCCLTTITLWAGQAWLAIYVFGWGFRATPRFTLEVVAKTVICLILSDGPFWFAHGILHRHLPSTHLLHHLCSNPSLSTNYMFEPLDVLFEFLLPMLTIAAITVGMLGDHWLFVTTFAGANVWYLLSHDPLLQFPHFYHHTRCDSRYTVYVSLKNSYDPNDKVRHMFFGLRRKLDGATKDD